MIDMFRFGQYTIMTDELNNDSYIMHLLNLVCRQLLHTHELQEK